jgi:hypothetical protein
MNAWSVFAPLWHALTTPRTSAFSFEDDWAGLLVRVGLAPSVFRDVVETNSLHPHFHYRHFSKRKKDGRLREIAEPDVQLKRIQHEIITRYFNAEQPHAAALAYRVGKSIADHAWTHAGAELLVSADIQDFFPSTRQARIEDWWRQRVDDDTARLLTRLTTYRGALPQGAPTSPALSNFVNHGLDERLTRRAQATGARYSRYCDDLAFSWPRGVSMPSDFDRGVRAVLHEFGYTLHPEKGWCVHSLSDEPEITGVILTRHGGVRLPDRLRQVMRVLARSDKPRDAERLQGYRNYRTMVTRPPTQRRGRKR